MLVSFPKHPAFIVFVIDPPLQAGSVVVSWVAAPIATWLTLLFLLAVHLYMNQAAVRSVSMRSLNRQRAGIVFAHLLAYDKVLSPQKVSQKERIFERDGVYRWTDDVVLGYGRMSVNLNTLIRAMVGDDGQSGRVHVEATQLRRLLEVFDRELYVLWFDAHVSTAYITLKEGATVKTQLKAWLHGLFLARENGNKDSPMSAAKCDQFQKLTTSLEHTTKVFNEYDGRIQAVGWDSTIAALETHSGTRLAIPTRHTATCHETLGI